MKKMILMMLSCIILFGCSHKHSLFNYKGYWIENDASRRGVIIIPKDLQIRICSEPSPDVALGVMTNISIPKEADTGSAYSLSVNTDPTPLDGRTQVVLFLREAMYRLCELSINYPEISADSMQSMYDKVIDQARKLADAVQQEATEKAIESRKALAEAETQKALAIERALKSLKE